MAPLYKTYLLSLIAVLSIASGLPASSKPFADRKNADDALFTQYSVPVIYHGRAHLPDFKGRDRDFAAFRTRIRQGLSDGVNFAGHYAVIFWGCGTECVEYVIGDVITGKVSSIPMGGEEYPEFRLHVRPKSRGAIATWLAYDRRFLDAPPGENVPDIRTCFSQSLIWNGSSLVALSKPVAVADNKNNPDLDPECPAD